jgi:hypothetical protein
VVGYGRFGGERSAKDASGVRRGLMTNLEQYVRDLEDHHHPAAALGRFLLSHSNSPEYLVSNLDAFVRVIQRDLDAERELAQRLQAAHS